MSCRTGSNAPLTGSAAAITGAPVLIVQKAFHALRREGERLNVAAPEPEEVVAFLRRRRELLKETEGVRETSRLLHKIGLSQAREQAEAGNVPDGPTWHAWQHILAESETRKQLARRDAAIFDIDGTLSDNSPMHHVPLPEPGPEANYDEWMSHTSALEPHLWVRNATHEVDDATEGVIITARSEKYRDITEAWLKKAGAKYDTLIMRPVDDQRPDHEYKQEALDKLERDRDIIFAMDDNPKVANMWLENEIPTIVVPGYNTSESPPPVTAKG